MENTRKKALLVDDPSASYHSNPAWGHSMFEGVRRSPWEAYRRFRTREAERTISPTLQRTFDDGSAAHAATLEPDEFPLRFVSSGVEGKRTKDDRAAWQAAKEAHPTALVMEPSRIERALAIAEAVRAHPVVGPCLERDGVAEGSIYWSDDEHGIACKCRPDWMVPPSADDNGCIIDLKTTAQIGTEDVARSVARYGYHRQQAHYTAGFRALYGVHPSAYVLVFACKTPPHEVGAWMLDDGSAELGEEQRRADVERVAELMERPADDWCRAANRGVSTLVLPTWAHYEGGIE